MHCGTLDDWSFAVIHCRQASWLDTTALLISGHVWPRVVTVTPKYTPRVTRRPSRASLCSLPPVNSTTFVRCVSLLIQGTRISQWHSKYRLKLRMVIKQEPDSRLVPRHATSYSYRLRLFVLIMLCYYRRPAQSHEGLHLSEPPTSFLCSNPLFHHQ